MSRPKGNVIILDPHRLLGGDLYLVRPDGQSREGQRKRRPSERAVLDCFSRREREVFQLMGKGYHTPQIATELCLKRKTVEAYREKLKAKLDFEHMHELILFAVQCCRVDGHSEPAPRPTAPT